MDKSGLWKKASYTVEAALVVPFAFLALMSFSCLFAMLLRQNSMQLEMVKAVQVYSSTGSQAASLGILFNDHALLQWQDIADGKICYVSSREGIPFIGSRFMKLHRYQQMVASHYKGVSMASDAEGDDIVYVAANGRVYHLDRECTYLRTRIQSIVVSQLETKRNESGGIYYPCESCCQSQPAAAESSVYIASYGNRYHIQSGCPKLKRTVRAVHQSELGDMPACSKCG